MKKHFLLLISVFAILFSSCSMMRQNAASVSVQLDGQSVYNACRAGTDDAALENEVYTATLEVTGDIKKSVSDEFSLYKDAVLKVTDLLEDSVINVTLKISAKDVLMFEGKKEGFVVAPGDNQLEIKMVSTGNTNPYTKFTVAYNSEFGEKIEAKTVYVNAELTKDDLPALEKDGYTFDGWYDGETKVEAGYKVTKDVTLTAKWTEVKQTEPDEETPEEKPETKTYKVTFASENGTAPKEKTVEENTVLTAEDLAVLTAEGFTFDGWYDGETKVEAGYKVTKDVTLTAKWTKVEQTDPDEEKPEDPALAKISLSVKINDYVVSDGHKVLPDDVDSMTLVVESEELTLQGGKYIYTYKCGDATEEIESHILDVKKLVKSRDAGDYKIDVEIKNKSDSSIVAKASYKFAIAAMGSAGVEITYAIPSFEINKAAAENIYTFTLVPANGADFAETCLFMWQLNGNTLETTGTTLVVDTTTSQYVMPQYNSVRVEVKNGTERKSEVLSFIIE